MMQKICGLLMATVLLSPVSGAAAQPEENPAHRGDPLGGVLATVVDGLRAGLKEFGLQEGKQFVLDIEDLKGDAKGVENVAKKFEQDKVKLIFTNTAGR